MSKNSKFNVAIILLSIVFACGCSHDDPPRQPALDPSVLDQQQAFQEVRSLLKVGRRDSGTDGARRAAEHIRDRLVAVGVDKVELDTFEDPTPNGALVFHNVIADIPGHGDGLVVIGSHFDTKPGIQSFQGANDSGSSTGLLIELARVITAAPALGYDLKLVFFDGEECIRNYTRNDGLHGSRRMAKHLIDSGLAKDVRAVIILDMIGDRDLNIRFPANTDPSLVSMAFQSAVDLGLRSRFGLSESSLIDDHLPFQQAGMPSINLIDFNFGSAPSLNDYWHTAADTIDKVAPESLGISGRVVLQMLNRLDK